MDTSPKSPAETLKMLQVIHDEVVETVSEITNAERQLNFSIRELNQTIRKFNALIKNVKKVKAGGVETNKGATKYFTLLSVK